MLQSGQRLVVQWRRCCKVLLMVKEVQAVSVDSSITLAISPDQISLVEAAVRPHNVQEDRSHAPEVPSIGQRHSLLIVCIASF